MAALGITKGKTGEIFSSINCRKVFETLGYGWGRRQKVYKIVNWLGLSRTKSRLKNKGSDLLILRYC